MACCVKCFDDDGLTRFIRKHGTRSSEPCGHCGALRTRQVDEQDLRELFLGLVEAEYCQFGELSQAPHTDAIEEGEYLAQLLAEDHGVFTEDVEAPGALLEAILSHPWSMKDDPDAARFEATELWARRADDWSHWSDDDYWLKLRSEIEEHGHGLFVGERFIGSKEAHQIYRAFLKDVALVAIKLGPESPAVWRARRGEGHDREALGATPPRYARAGRANLQGQPVFYGAGDRDTALAEVRPSIGDVVSVGKFGLQRSVRVADLTTASYVSPFASLRRYQRYRRQRELCEALGRQLSTPVRPEDEPESYLVTQFMAAMIARSGLDGIRFNSSQHGGGQNYAFFDPSCLQQLEPAQELSVTGVDYTSTVR